MKKNKKRPARRRPEEARKRNEVRQKEREKARRITQKTTGETKKKKKEAGEVEWKKSRKNNRRKKKMRLKTGTQDQKVSVVTEMADEDCAHKRGGSSECACGRQLRGRQPMNRLGPVWRLSHG